MSYRDKCRPIIAEVIRRVGRSDMKALKKRFREAYPWGERAMWPYKVWCSEVRRQLNPEIRPLTAKRRLLVPAANQKQLFEE